MKLWRGAETAPGERRCGHRKRAAAAPEGCWEVLTLAWLLCYPR